MKLFVSVILVLTIVASEAFPGARQPKHTVAALLSKEHAGASEDFLAVANAWFQFIAKSEESVWRAAKEIEGILATIDAQDVAKEVTRMFYKAYDATLYQVARVYNNLNPDDDLAYTVVIIKFEGVIGAITSSYYSNTKIKDFLKDNAPEILPQVVAIDDRALDEIGVHLDALYAVLDEYDDYES